MTHRGQPQNSTSTRRWNSCKLSAHFMQTLWLQSRMTGSSNKSMQTEHKASSSQFGELGSAIVVLKHECASAKKWPQLRLLRYD